MNDAYDYLTLELCSALSPVLLRLHKNDSARRVVFRLREDGRDYRIAPGTTAVFRAKKPDGTVLFNACTIDGQTVVYRTTTQTTAAPGLLECELTLYGGEGNQLTSARFRAIVEDTLYSDSEVESEDEFTALAQAVASAGNLDLSAEREGKTAEITVVRRDGSEETVTVTDGCGIVSVSKTSSSGDTNTYTVTYEDGRTDTFTVENGRSVTGTRIVNGHLIVSYSDGTESDAGELPGGSGGTSDHRDLTNRDASDSHPMSAITGLSAGLAGKQGTLSAAQLAAANSGATEEKIGGYDTHVANGDLHVTAAKKAEWDAKQDSLTFDPASELAVTDEITEDATDSEIPTAAAVYAYIQSLDGNGVSY